MRASEAVIAARDNAPVIRTVMNGRDWLILGILAVIWGGAFFFIGVAVHQVAPLTYVWVRLTIAAAAMSGVERSSARSSSSSDSGGPGS